MKNFLLLMSALAVMASCTNKTSKSNEAENPDVEKYCGFVKDATMNNVNVQAVGKEETKNFFIGEGTIDNSQNAGILIGVPICVEYTNEKDGSMKVTKITTDATYNDAVGNWIVPTGTSDRFGIQLNIEGKAESINMATLTCTGWELEGKPNKIIVHSISEGSGAPIKDDAVFTINDIDGKLSLINDDGIVMYVKEEVK